MNMKKTVARCVLAGSVACIPLPSIASHWIDDAYLVAAQGSATRITQVSMADAAPWILLDLNFIFDPAQNIGLDAISFSADWTHDQLGLRINDAPASYGAASDKL